MEDSDLADCVSELVCQHFSVSSWSDLCLGDLPSTLRYYAQWRETGGGDSDDRGNAELPGGGGGGRVFPAAAVAAAVMSSERPAAADSLHHPAKLTSELKELALKSLCIAPMLSELHEHTSWQQVRIDLPLSPLPPYFPFS